MFCYTHQITYVVLNPKGISTSGLGSFAFARRYLQNRFFFLLLWVLRCFSSPRLPPHTLCIYVWVSSFFLLDRFPHSDIHGSTFICNYPWLFAAYHVLLRLSVPRHSPYALCSLTYFLCFRFIVLLVRFFKSPESLLLFVSLLFGFFPI